MRIGALVALTLCVAVWASAQEAAPKKAPHGKLMEADTNKDGVVSFEELSAARPGITQERFKQMDRNGDGVLSPADRPQKPEGQAAPKSPQAAQLSERFKVCDKDSDGKVSSEEFTAAFPKAPLDRFAKLDRNKDGALTADEMTPKAPEGQEAAERLAKFKKADADGDGKLTFEEVSKVRPELTQAQFDNLDKNKDGALTPPEMAPKRPEGREAGERLAKLQKADTDGDGKVTFEEASKAKPELTQAQFDTLDRNKDGVVSKLDAPQAGGEAKNAGQRLRAADTDKDQRVSWDEAHAALPEMTKERFDRLDRNGDGFISKEDRATKP